MEVGKKREPKTAIGRFLGQFIPLAVFLTIASFSLQDHSSLRAASPDGSAAEKKEDTEQKRLKRIRADIQFGAANQQMEAMDHVKRLEKDRRPDFLDVISEAMNSVDPSVRKKVVDTLGKIDSPAAKKLLMEEGLKDNDSDVRRTAVYSLRDLKAEESSDLLFQMIQKEDFHKSSNHTLTGAISALGSFAYKEASSFFLEKLKDPQTDPSVQRHIVLYFGSAKAKDAIPALLEILKSETEETVKREYAVNSLGKIGDSSVLSALQGELKKIHAMPSGEELARNNRLKLQLLAALVRLGDDDVVQELKSAAKDANAGLRYRAVQYLGDLNQKDARDLLEYKAEHDPDARVRKKARSVLDGWDGKTDSSDEAETEPEEDEMP